MKKISIMAIVLLNIFVFACTPQQITDDTTVPQACCGDDIPIIPPPPPPSTGVGG